MSWKNRLKNLAATPMRLLGSVGYAGVDAAKTGTALAKDPAEISMNTVQDIQELFQEAGKRGTMRHKLGNLPWATALSGIKLGEGTIRSGVNTAVNFIKNSWGTLKNFGSNVITSLAHTFSPKPISDVSFKHLSTEAVSKNWNLKTLLIGAGIAGSVAATAAPQAQAASEPTPIVAEAPKPVDQQSKQHINSLTQELDAQKQSNKQLDDKVSQLVKKSEEQNKLMQQQLKQKDDMIAALQKSHGEKNNNEKDSNDESPKKKPRKTSS